MAKIRKKVRVDRLHVGWHVCLNTFHRAFACNCSFSTGLPPQQIITCNEVSSDKRHETRERDTPKGHEKIARVSGTSKTRQENDKKRETEEGRRDKTTNQQRCGIVFQMFPPFALTNGDIWIRRRWKLTTARERRVLRSCSFFSLFYLAFCSL